MTVLALWYAFRDVDFAQLGREMAKADLLIMIPGSVACYVGAIFIRALRWRYLLRAMGDFETGALFRATAIGFMVNNLFPLRLGEVVRSLVLADEADCSRGAVFGTVIVERVIDALCVLMMAALVLGTAGAAATGVDSGQALFVLSLIASIPLLAVVALRLAPDQLIGLATHVVGWVLPDKWTAQLEHLLREIAAGLTSLRGGTDLAWVVFHSLFCWMVLATVPFYLAILALGLDLGGVAENMRASMLTMVLVGAAVAVPSVPGFAGTYHAACKAALVPLGVSPELALALGTLAHLIFWLSMTGTGLITLRYKGTGLTEAMAGAGTTSSDPDPQP